ncbi:uncharacterized protein LOC120945125 [Rana temporaria]|uniref:uncharacterized protein LOC120945125 n=1 Tax=Rana temporaria TaxID=8407 RepID=UPI001AACB80E|nr:uncharacterized protein LOC120945125 [Rana temporaria]
MPNTTFSLPVETRRCISRPGNGQRTFIAVLMASGFSNSIADLYIVTCDKAATVTVTVPYSSFSKTVNVSRNSSAGVTLSSSYTVTEAYVTNKAVLVTSDVEVSVFLYHHASGHGDAMALLPLEDLGTEYFIPSLSQSGSYKEFAVANGLQENVQLTITVSGHIAYNGANYYTGHNISVTLGRQQVIQFYSSTDLTGTRVLSTAPVAVFSGHNYYYGPSGSYDPIFEQIHPVRNWGTFFAIFPLFNHTRDIVDIISANADTVVNVTDLGKTTQHSLQRGSRVQLTLKNEITVKSSKPIMISYVFQESKSWTFVSAYNPFLTTVPPSLLGLNYYQFYTKNIYYSFLMIISQTSSVSGFYLDQKPLSSYSYWVKESGGFWAWEVSLGKSEGRHEIFHKYFTFTIYVYGVESYTSFGYSMGQETLHPASLQCLSRGAEYRLPYNLLAAANLKVLDIHLEDPQCQGHLEGREVLLKIPFTQCGSTLQHDENGKSYYKNTIYGTVPNTDVHRIEVPVKCELDSNQTINFNLVPQIASSVSRGGNFNISLKLYKSDSFTHPITEFPVEVDLHSILYVELVVESHDKDLQILAEHVKSSPLLNSSEKSYNIIKHGCLQDSTLQTYPTTDRRLQRFSFHVFKFKDVPGVYLSCDVVICHNRTSANRCAQGCLSPRQKRHIHNSDSASLAVGPILLNKSKPSPGVPSSLFVAAVCVVGVLAVTGLVVQRRYYKKQQYIKLHNCYE